MKAGARILLVMAAVAVGTLLTAATSARQERDARRIMRDYAKCVVNARFATSGETSFDNRLPLAHLPFPERAMLDAELATTNSKRKRADLEASFSTRVGVAWLSRYGECIVRQDPVRARLLLLTPPDGPEETSRINDLRPALAGCLADGTMKFNRVTVRGTVAINYYRLALATPVAGKAN